MPSTENWPPLPERKEPDMTFSEEVGLLILAMLDLALENPTNQKILIEIKRLSKMDN